MADISLDLDPLSTTFNDIKIVDNDLLLTSQTDAILQNVLQALRTYLGEWFLNINIGVAYFQEILVKNPDKQKIDALFQNAILSVPGIIQLNTYTSNIDTITRQFYVRFRATATTGVIDYAGLI